MDCELFLGTGIFSPCLNGSFECLLRFLVFLFGMFNFLAFELFGFAFLPSFDTGAIIASREVATCLTAIRKFAVAQA